MEAGPDLRVATALGLAVGLIVVALAGCATPVAQSYPPPPPIDLSMIEEGSGGVIAGSVRTPDGHPVAGARVVLLSTALPSRLAVLTDKDGIYRFTQLPPGNYSIQVVFGHVNTHKITQLPEQGRFRAHFVINPH